MPVAENEVPSGRFRSDAGDQGGGSAGHATGNAHDQVDVDVAAVRKSVCVEESLQCGQLTEIEDLVLGYHTPLLHPGVQVDDELPPVQEDVSTEVDSAHRA